MIEKGDALRRPSPKREDFTNERIIAALRNNGGIVKAAGLNLGVSRKTLAKWIEDDPELKEAKDDMIAELCDLAESVVFKNLKEGSFEAARYVLRCFGRQRGWIEVVRGEFEGPVIQQQAIFVAAETFDSKFAQILAGAAGGGASLLPDPAAEGP
jgi:lambda repressor-like predicted transcriptional regulator